MSEEYLQEVTLPSRGIFYNGEVPDGVVTIEPMGTREEKLFASGKSGDLVLDKIFDQCIGIPIPHRKLVLGDRLYLLLRLRTVSYGDEYSFPFRCSECEKKSYASIHLSCIQVKSPKEGADPTFSVELPILGNTLELRLLTGEDNDKAKRYVQQLTRATKKGEADVGGLEYVYRAARRIVSIDGEPCGIKEAMELVEKLKGMDSIAVRDAIDENEVGPILEVEPECNHCRYVNGPLTIPMDREFFRPKRNRPNVVDHIAAAEALDARRETSVE